MIESAPVIPLWPRTEHTPGGGKASVILFCFSDEPLRDEQKLSASRYGVSSTTALDALGFRTIERSEDPAWFTSWLSGSIRDVADQDLGEASTRLDSARFCHALSGTWDDPPDLAYLQGSWATARWLIDRGVHTLLDAHRGRWLKASDVSDLAVDREFDIQSEISVIFETDERAPGEGHVVHTRGLSKFGRPDLMLAGLSRSHGDRGADALLSIAQMLAMGRVIKAGDSVQIPGFPLLSLEDYRPGENGPDVHLNNEGLIVLDAHTRRTPSLGY